LLQVENGMLHCAQSDIAEQQLVCERSEAKGQEEASDIHQKARIQDREKIRGIFSGMTSLDVTEEAGPMAVEALLQHLAVLETFVSACCFIDKYFPQDTQHFLLHEFLVINQDGLIFGRASSVRR
jgi:hypothetical protein